VNKGEPVRLPFVFYQYFPHISPPGADFFKDGAVFSLVELADRGAAGSISGGYPERSNAKTRGPDAMSAAKRLLRCQFTSL
jgi:hypothetical protein